ncbi:MAG: UDP-N-acetylmuramoyl-L-alanyl-D-glutamate--2,6-diaminopimelate ligase [Gammaproteobacteria bacterium]|nr:UDP-N-acetylmuramoyl-L-alanyl-D-glutamate--2,6-diaminopimelate ligase [Gammaproteobacteria bacterium]
MAPQLKSSDISLGTLLCGYAAVRAQDERQISGVCMDSRRVRSGDLFLACTGTRTSGVRYIDEALKRGAAAVAIEADGAVARLQDGVPVIPIADLRARAGIIVSRFFGDPSAFLNVIGITGTNGKSSVAHYIAGSLHRLKPGSAGMIGTLGYGPFGQLAPAALTTPDPVTLQGEFAYLRNLGVQTVVMEVSSHALQQGRIAGVAFQTAVFTNLSRDHLDFHRDMQDYSLAKRRLFEQAGLRQAVLNLDDAFGLELYRQFADRLETAGFTVAEEPEARPQAGRIVTAWIEEATLGLQRLRIRSPWGEGPLRCALTGRFNASNVLAALTVLCLRGVSFEQAVTVLQLAVPVAGRMECFTAPGRPTVVVDYAHTPDALAQALEALRPHCRGTLICVFGCGGDRDRGKRAEMGAAAEANADRLVITSDNPRSEPPLQIIEEISTGLTRGVPVRVEPDRIAAVTAAIREARPVDVVLVAGKGHETYQEIAGRRISYSDRLLVQDLLRERA